MSGRRRMKTIAYDEDDFWYGDTDYSEEEEEDEEKSHGPTNKARNRDGTLVQKTVERNMRERAAPNITTASTDLSGARSSAAKQRKNVPSQPKRATLSATTTSGIMPKWSSSSSSASSSLVVTTVLSHALTEVSASMALDRNSSMSSQGDALVADISDSAFSRPIEDSVKRETVNDGTASGESSFSRVSVHFGGGDAGASLSPKPGSLHSGSLAGRPPLRREAAGQQREAQTSASPSVEGTAEHKSTDAGKDSLLQAPAALRAQQASDETRSTTDCSVDAGKSSYSLVVIGHVDAGKSTLTGQLLFRTGAVNERQVEKMKRMSAAAGKGSFCYAWMCDEGDDERQRGITVDVSVRVIVTAKIHRRICFLDAPGHHELVSNMLGGAVLADAALLVVDAARLEVGFEGQTREHLLIARSLNIQHFAVAVNKMDEVGWSEKAYNDVVERLRAFLTGPEIGCPVKQIYFVPISALVGVNLVSEEVPEQQSQPHKCVGRRQKNSADAQRKRESVWNTKEMQTQTELLRSWWKGPSLLDLLEDIQIHTLAAQRQLSNEPFTASVADMLSISSSEELSLSFKVISGCLSVGDKVAAMPANVTFVCKALSSYGIEQKSCTSGDFVEKGNFALIQSAPAMDKNTPSAGIEAVGVGTVFCTSMRLLRVVSSFFCKVVVFSREMPLMPGRQLVAYIHTVTCQCIVRKVVAIIDKKTGEAVKQKQARRCALVYGMKGILEIDVSPGKVCLRAKKEQHEQTTSLLSRVVLRDRTGTAAAGVVVEDVEV